MKNLQNVLIIVMVMIIIASCGSKKPGTTVADDPTAAVCVWDKVSLKEAPGESGKWLASINLGEKCTYLKDTKTDNSGKKTLTFYKVKLQDGTEGWAQSDFIILNSKPAAIIKETDVYSRPDLLTKSKKTFSPMDIVAVKTQQDGWLEITGKRKNGKWIESGWIKPTDVSYSAVDIAVANFACKALVISDKQKKKEAIKEITENSSFKESVFISTLKEMLSEPATAEKTGNEAIEIAPEPKAE